jgi:hypothetical protein
VKNSRWLRNNIPYLSWQHLTASLLVGSTLGFLAYIFYLQTSVFSRRYLLLGILIVIAGSLTAYFLLKRHPFAFKNDYFISWQALFLQCLLFFLALPSYFFLPPYPKLPFFQHKSTLVITVETGATPVVWSHFRRIYLNSGVEKLGFRGFQIAGPWISHGDDFILPPESAGQIIWNGRVGRRASLAIPIPSSDLAITTNWDGEIRQAPSDKSPYIQNKNFTPPLWYAGLIYAVVWIPLFFIFMLMDGFPLIRRIALPALIFILALIQVNLQFQMLGMEFHKPIQEAIETVQLPRHVAVLNGEAPNPWQYRVFSEWILEVFIYISSRLLKLDNAVYISLLGLRILQNFLLLTLAYVYFIKLGTTKTVSLYGVFLLAGGMMHVFYQSDLSFNTYFDVIFFLLAAILILDEKYVWVPVLLIFAALNRETSIMIPVLLIAWGWLGKSKDRTKVLVSGFISLFVWGLVFTALHLYYPNAPMFKIGDELLPGWGLFRYNFSIPEMPILLFQTLGFLPLIAVIAHRHWHLFVRICFLLLVPTWILVHAFSSVWAETRLFLVLLALVFVPAVLPLVDRRLQEIREEALWPLSKKTQSLFESQVGKQV